MLYEPEAAAAEAATDDKNGAEKRKNDIWGIIINRLCL